MKKIFLITYLFFFFISGICQNHIDSADCRAWLEKDISTIKLPIYYEHFTVKNIYISGNDIVFEGCVQDNVNVDTTTNNFIEGFKESMYEMHFVYDEGSYILNNSGFGILFIIKTNDLKPLKQFYISPTEVKNILNGTVHYMKEVKETVAEINKLTPVSWGSGFTLVSAEIKGNYFVYNIINDESLYTYHNLKAFDTFGNPTIKNWMKQNLNWMINNDGLENIVDIVMANLGVAYSIKSGNHDDAISFRLTPKEMVKLLSDAAKK